MKRLYSSVSSGPGPNGTLKDRWQTSSSSLILSRRKLGEFDRQEREPMLVKGIFKCAPGMWKLLIVFLPKKKALSPPLSIRKCWMQGWYRTCTRLHAWTNVATSLAMRRFSQSWKQVADTGRSESPKKITTKQRLRFIIDFTDLRICNLGRKVPL